MVRHYVTITDCLHLTHFLTSCVSKCLRSGLDAAVGADYLSFNLYNHDEHGCGTCIGLVKPWFRVCSKCYCATVLSLY